MPDKLNLKRTTDSLLSYQHKINSLDKTITKIVVDGNEFEVKNVLGRSAMKKRINQKNWKGLHDTSVIKFNKLDKQINDLFSHLSEKNNTLALRNDILDKLKPFVTPVKSLKNWKEKKKVIIEQLTKKKIETRLINMYVKNLEDFDFKKHLAFEDKILKHENELIKISFNKLLKDFSYRYYSYICAKTNLNVAGKKNLSTIKSNAASTEKLVSDQYKQVKKLLKDNKGKIVSQCKSSGKILSNCIENKLLPLAVSLYTTKVRNKRELDTKIDLSLKTGMLIRKSMLLIVACKRIQFDYINKDLSNGFLQWVKSSSIKNIEYLSKIEVVKPGALNTNGRAYNNKLIAVKGKVKKIKIRHVARKPISHAFIYEGKNIVRATIPYIKIDSGGMCPGAYVEIMGTWLEKNKESFNKPSLNIDRVDNIQESKKSWISWVSLQMNDVYQLMPHSINAKLSWKPGKNGAINPIKYSLI